MGEIKNKRRFQGTPKLTDYIKIDVSGKDVRIPLSDLLSVFSEEIINSITSDDVTYLDPVISQTNTPAVGPTTGDRYLVSTVPTGDWAGHANEVAEWDGATWVYTVPVLDNVIFITNTLTTKRFNGSAWIAYSGAAILQNGNTFGSSMAIGTKDNQLVYIKVNNGNVIRVGNASNTFRFPTLIGSTSAGTVPATSAMLEVKSTTSGFLAPRMTLAQRTAIPSPATGLIVYQTDGFVGHYHYNGTAWVQLVDSVAPYKSCHFTLTQDLTGDPVATILGNDTGSTLTFAYSDVGEYTLTLSVGASSAEKFVLIPGINSPTGTFDISIFSGTFGVLRTYNSAGAPANSIFSNTFFELRIYL